MPLLVSPRGRLARGGRLPSLAGKVSAGLCAEGKSGGETEADPSTYPSSPLLFAKPEAGVETDQYGWTLGWGWNQGVQKTS